MTVYKGVNAFGNNPGDSLRAPVTTWSGHSGMPGGKLERYPGPTGDISGGNRRLAKATYGEGDGMATVMRGTNAFTRSAKRGKV